MNPEQPTPNQPLNPAGAEDAQTIVPSGMVTPTGGTVTPPTMGNGTPVLTQAPLQPQSAGNKVHAKSTTKMALGIVVLLVLLVLGYAFLQIQK